MRNIKIKENIQKNRKVEQQGCRNVEMQKSRKGNQGNQEISTI